MIEGRKKKGGWENGVFPLANSSCELAPRAAGSPSPVPVAVGLVGSQGSAVVKPNSSCLQEAWKDSPPLQCMLILSASLWAAAGALIWRRELEPCCGCHNPAVSSVTAALPEAAAAAVPQGKGQRAMGADTKRGETVSSEGQKESNP